MAKKKAKSPKKSKSKNLVLYVEDSTMKAKTFTDVKKAQKFIDNFKNNENIAYDGYWIDLLVTDIGGDVVSFDCIQVD